MPESTPFARLSALAGIVAAVLVPLAIALFGHFYGAALKERELQGQFVALAVAILREPPQSDTTRALRGWAIDVVNRYSGVTLPETLRMQLESQIALPTTAEQAAPALEQRAFDALFRSEWQTAADLFEAAEAARPGFHSVYELGRLLRRPPYNLNTPDGRRQLFGEIAQRYTYGLPPDIRARLDSAAGR